MRNDELSYNLGEVVDRLISVQYFMSGGGSALTRKPVTGVLYEAAREKAGAPLSHLAAKALADNVKRGDTVLVTTGLVATPIIVCEAVVVKALEALCQAAGLMPSAPELALGTRRKVIILPFPLDEELVSRWAQSINDSEKELFPK